MKFFKTLLVIAAMMSTAGLVGCGDKDGDTAGTTATGTATGTTATGTTTTGS